MEPSTAREHDQTDHSEKVRRLLSEIPPSLVRWGAGVIIIIVILLVLVACMVPYPYSGGESILEHILNP